MPTEYPPASLTPPGKVKHPGESNARRVAAKEVYVEHAELTLGDLRWLVNEAEGMADGAKVTLEKLRGDQRDQREASYRKDKITVRG